MRSILQGSLAIIFSIILIGANAQSISTARNQSIGSSVTVRGIVLNGSEFGSTRFIQDATGGISAFGNNIANLLPGDSVEIKGTLANQNQLLQISPVSSSKIFSRANRIPTAKVLSAATAFSENYESQLVRVNGVTISGSGNFSGNTDYNINQAGTQKEIRVNSGSNLVGTAIPQGKVHITGVMSQFGFTWNTGYQLFPRTYKDIIPEQGPGILEPIESDIIDTSSITVTYKTQRAGSSIMFFGTDINNLLNSVIDTNKRTNHIVRVQPLLPGTIYYIRAVSVNHNGDSSFSSITPIVTKSLSSGKISVIFNRSVDHSVAQNVQAVYANRAMDDSLIQNINRAKESIDICIYNWNNNGLSDITAALNNAFNRGVKIRIITDGGTATTGLNTLNNQVPRLLSPQGSAYSIMHNKFMIIDCDAANPNLPVMLTGSTNWTQGQINVDPNNMIFFQDRGMCKVFRMEFDEMWGSSGMTPNATASRFGSFKTNNTPHLVNVAGTPVEVFFSPSDDVEDELIESLLSADSDIEVGTNHLTRSSISNTIISVVQAKGIYGAAIIGDIGIASPYNALKATTQMAGQVFHWNLQGIFHHKYMIIDQNQPGSDPQVWTGSHNWSNNANTKNDENTVLVHNWDIANQYFQEWLQRYKELGGSIFVTDVDALSKNDGIKVFPNPTQGSLQILGLTQSSAPYSLHNLSGILVNKGSVKNGEIMNLTNEAGFYFLNILDNGKIRRIKLVITN